MHGCSDYENVTTFPLPHAYNKCLVSPADCQQNLALLD